MTQNKFSDMTMGASTTPMVGRSNMFSKIGNWFSQNQRFSATTRQAFLVTAASIFIAGFIAICASPFLFEFGYRFYIAIFLAFTTGLIFGMFFAMVFVTGIIMEQFETIKNKMGIYIMPVVSTNVDNSDYDFSSKIDKSKLN